VGARGTPEEAPPTRFGTVRPRVQIPGPRPILNSETSITALRPALHVTAVSTDFPAYGIMYGVKRTTIYLPEDLKSSLARAAHEAGRTEADMIREGVERLLQSRHTEPRLPLFKSGKADLAEKVDELLAGFGEE